MKAVEAIILAGGLGTRLRSVVSDTPKCMAIIAGQPFLYYVIENLKKEGVTKFIFSLGYLNEIIIAYLKKQYPSLSVQFSIEEEPLGTGGAIKMACQLTTEKEVLIVNGDTLFTLDIQNLIAFHKKNNADCTLSLKPMHHFDRYGVVEVKTDHRVASFREKMFFDTGLINAGVYVLNAAKFMKEDLPGMFSFEKDYLEKYFHHRKIYAVVYDNYFIDIGIPEDFERAQTELKQ